MKISKFGPALFPIAILLMSCGGGGSEDPGNSNPTPVAEAAPVEQVTSPPGGSATNEPVKTNQAPIANAERSGRVFVNQLIKIDGSASSDPDNDPLSYSWKMQNPEGSSSVLNSSTSSSTTFTPDVPGIYTLTLTVSDGKSSSTSNPVEVTAFSNGFNVTATGY